MDELRVLPLDDILDKLKEIDKNKKYDCSPHTTSSGFHLLHFLVLLTKDRPDIVQYIKQLITNDKSVINIVNHEGWTALHLASRNSNTVSSIDTVKLLIDAGCLLDIQNKDGWTALHMAFRYLYNELSIKTVKLLIDAGCSLDIQNKDGWTALHMACRYLYNELSIKTVKLLIDAGCSLDIQTNCGFTALHLVFRNTEGLCIETIKLLIHSGCSLDIQHKDGWIPLHLASICTGTNINKDSLTEAIKLLLLNCTLSDKMFKSVIKNCDNIKEFIKCVLHTKVCITDKILNKMIKFYSINDEEFYTIISRSSKYKTHFRSLTGVTDKMLTDKINEIRLKPNSITVTILNYKHEKYCENFIRNESEIQKIKDYLGINNDDKKMLHEAIDNYLIKFTN